MQRPDVVRIVIESPQRHLLRLGVQSALLQPEGQHAQDLAVALGHRGSVRVAAAALSVLRPERQHARRASAKVASIAEEEVGVVAGAESEDFARNLEQVALENARGAAHPARTPLAQRGVGGEVAAIGERVARRVPERSELVIAAEEAARSKRRLRSGDCLPYVFVRVANSGGQEVEQTLGAVREHELGVILHGPGEQRDRVAAESEVLRDGLVKMGHGASRGRVDRQAVRTKERGPAGAAWPVLEVCREILLAVALALAVAVAVASASEAQERR